MRWFFWNEAYINWRRPSGSKMLWVHGKLGSGKTVLLANLVVDLYRSPRDEEAHPAVTDFQAIVAYVFCNHDRPNSNTYELIMESIVQQILAQMNPDSDVVVMMEAYFRRNPPSTLHDDLIGILRRFLPRDRAIFVIMDALEECSVEVAHAVLATIRSISDTRLSILSCCLTRSASPLSIVISNAFRTDDLYSVAMSCPVAEDEMRMFINAEFERRRHVRELDPSLEETLKEFLIEASEGM